MTSSTVAKRSTSSRLLRSARSGWAEAPQMARPATARPAWRAAAIVSAVWLTMPGPVRQTMITGRSSARARSAKVRRATSGSSRPPEPSTITPSQWRRSSATASTIVAISTGASPSARAASAGASADS